LQNPAEVFGDVSRKRVDKYLAPQQYTKKYRRNKHTERMIATQ
jgi:hypothetical protein